MKKNINYNYVIVCYDVGEKRVNKVFKICKKYGIGIANNDFASSIGTITNNYKFFKTSVCKAKNLIFDVQYSRKIRTQIVAAIRGMK